MNFRRCLDLPLPFTSAPSGPVIYWMHRDLRVADNWGLTHARELALAQKTSLCVLFCLAPSFLDATWRHFHFLLHGLAEMEQRLRELNIPLLVLSGHPEEEISRYVQNTRASVVVTDFDPLRIKRIWVNKVRSSCSVPVQVVDSRNIVPCWIASDKREYMAKTIRPKIWRNMQEFLTPFPDLPPHPHGWPVSMQKVDFDALRKTVSVDQQVGPVEWCVPGEKAGVAMLQDFLAQRLRRYGQRNDPNQDVCSRLSAYLHFGMLSAQRVVLEVMSSGQHGEQVDAFLEELIVRRELSDNFCWHTPDYDAVSGFLGWAQESLEMHRDDTRPVRYELPELEHAATHDPLWNAAQRQMVRSGTMHGYLRMYWAKKILEWTSSAAEALRVAIYLNDRYSLDGRDTNGYTGIAWSIGGVHDRGWTERPIFGKIRYMNYQGARRKFDVDAFTRTWA